MEFSKELVYFIYVFILSNFYSLIEMIIKILMSEMTAKSYKDTYGEIRNFNLNTKYKKEKPLSVCIQIRPTFDLYCRIHNILNFEQKMMFEVVRLESFKSAPATLCLWKIKLAKSGFYYTGDRHKCQCAFCGFSYDSWTENDDPEDVHRRLQPNCPFLTDRINTNNISIHADAREPFQRRSPAFFTSSTGHFRYPAVSTDGYVSRFQPRGSANDIADRNTISSVIKELIKDKVKNESAVQRENSENVSSNISTHNEQTNLSRNDTTHPIRIPTGNVFLTIPSVPSDVNSERLSASNMIFIKRARYPKLAQSIIRLASFANWPSYFSQTPENMVDAGFFYTGKEDHCRCFFCGGGLRKWEVGDLPWTEHARWYPKCEFVKECMGEKFIEDVQHGKDPQNISNSSHSEQKFESKGLNSYTNHPAVQTIIEFGYEPNVVKSAYTSLQTAGFQDITARLLFERINEIGEGEHNQLACYYPVEISSKAAHGENNHTNDTPNDEHADIGIDIEDITARLLFERINEIGEREHNQLACYYPVESSSKAAHEENNHTNDTPNDEHADIGIDIDVQIKLLEHVEEENMRLKREFACKICLDEPYSIVFLPCAHVAACEYCAPALRWCPICKTLKEETVKFIYG